MPDKQSLATAPRANRSRFQHAPESKCICVPAAYLHELLGWQPRRHRVEVAKSNEGDGHRVQRCCERFIGRPCEQLFGDDRRHRRFEQSLAARSLQWSVYGRASDGIKRLGSYSTHLFFELRERVLRGPACSAARVAAEQRRRDGGPHDRNGHEILQPSVSALKAAPEGGGASSALADSNPAGSTATHLSAVPRARRRKRHRRVGDDDRDDCHNGEHPVDERAALTYS